MEKAHVTRGKRRPYVGIGHMVAQMYPDFIRALAVQLHKVLDSLFTHR
jgi:hypothetical protein